MHEEEIVSICAIRENRLGHNPAAAAASAAPAAAHRGHTQETFLLLLLLCAAAVAATEYGTESIAAVAEKRQRTMFREERLTQSRYLR